MADISDSSANSKSDSFDSYFSSSMGIETLNDLNNNPQVHALPNLKPVIISDHSKSNGVSSRTIFGNNFLMNLLTLFLMGSLQMMFD